MPEMPKRITINCATSKVYIDGIEFPWLIDEAGPTIERLDRDSVPVIHLPLLAEDVEIIPAKPDRASHETTTWQYVIRR